MRASAAASRAPAIPVRVLVPYILTHGGGVRSVLRAGLPRVAVLPGIAVTYAELCCNQPDMDEQERAGVAVDRDMGLPGASILSGRRGWRRTFDLGRQTSRVIRLARRVARRLEAYDVCWVHGHRELLLVLAARALSAAHPAVVWHWHGPPLSLDAGPSGSRSGRRLATLASRGCARVIAVSGFCAGQAARMGVEPERVVTVPNAAAIRKAPADGAALPARPESAFVSLVACAALRRHKGIHVAVQALRHLGSHHVLWITGDPKDPAAAEYVDELERIAERAGARARLRFVGVRADVHAVMKRADAVLVPSLWDEPFGLVAAEAQLLGVPVVVSNRGALPEIVGNGGAGLVFDPEDPEGLAAAIRSVEARSAAGSGRVEAARRRAEERYGYERWSSEIAAVLTDAAGRG